MKKWRKLKGIYRVSYPISPSKAYETEKNKALFNVQVYSKSRYYLWTYVFTL